MNEVDLSLISYPCPSPLEFNPNIVDPLIETACQLPCIIQAEMVFSSSFTLHQLFLTWSILSWISMILVIVVVVIFLSFPLGRSWPHRITIYLGIAHFWCHLTGVGGSFFNLEELLCDDRFLFQYSGWVKFQAWSIYFGALSTSCWWMVQGLTIFWNITMLQPENDLMKRLEPIFHLFCWGYPLIVACILTWVPSNLASGGSPSGFPFGTATQYSSVGLMWGLFIGVYCGFIFLNLICISTAMFRIVSTPFSDQKHHSGRRFSAELLILMFMLVFLNLIIAFIAVASYKTEHASDLEHSLVSFTNCLLTTHEPTETCHLPFTYDPFYFCYQIITWGSFGVCFALIFLVFKIQTRQHLAQLFSTSFLKSSYPSNQR